MFISPHTSFRFDEGALRPLPAVSAHRYAPGSCGALVQGRLDGVDFLINSPIDRYSRAWTRDTSRPGIEFAAAGALPKTAAAIAEMERRHSVPGGFEVILESWLPQGKGIASSTADHVAAISAISARTGLWLSCRQIADILTAVEPSDCTHVFGVAMVGHLCGRIFDSFPVPRDLRVLMVDCGEAAHTMSLDRERARCVYARNETLVRATLKIAQYGLLTGDAIPVAQAATTSAKLSQQIRPKLPFEELAKLTAANGGIGINCAHRGSMLGLLYEGHGGAGPRLRQAVEHAFGADLSIIGDHRFVSGSVHAHIDS